MSPALATLSYQGEERQVRWQGHALSNGSAFGSFMQNDVAARLNDEEGTTEFESHLRSLSLTEFGSESLETVLNANSPEERDWAVGEAMAEAWLEKEHQVIWPWNVINVMPMPAYPGRIWLVLLETALKQGWC